MSRPQDIYFDYNARQQHLREQARAPSRCPRRRWPPSPSAEEEAVALAYEFRPGPPDAGGREARSRGSLDQNPIIIDVDVPLGKVQRPPAREREVSAQTGGTSGGSTTSEDTSGPETPGDSSSEGDVKNEDRRYVFIPKEGVEIPLTYDEPRNPIHAKHSSNHAHHPAPDRGRMKVPKLETDLPRAKSSHDVPFSLERERSPYRSTPQTREVRASGEFLLSPEAMTPNLKRRESPIGTMNAQQRVPNPAVNRVTVDPVHNLRHPSRPSMIRHASAMPYPGYESSTPNSSKQDDSQRGYFRDDLRLEPDAVESPRRSSAVPLEHHSMRRQYHTRQASVPLARTVSESTDRLPAHPTAIQSHAATQGLNAMFSSPLTDRRRASPRNSPRSSPQASPTFSTFASPPRTPPADAGSRKTSYVQSTRASGSNSRPSSPLHPPHPPRASGNPTSDEDHYMRPRPTMRSRRTSPLPAVAARHLEPGPAPQINVQSPSPGGRQRSSSHLGDDYRARSRHRVPSVEPQVADSQKVTLRPGALESKRRSSSFVHSRPSLPIDSLRAEQKDHDSESRRPSLNAPTATRAASVGAPPAALPPCSRPEPVAGYNDWFSLRDNPSFKICPTCREAVTEAGYGRHLIVAFSRSPDRPIRCSFGIPWNRMAYLLMIKKRRPDVDLLYNIAEVAEDTVPCTGNRPAVRDWYRIDDMDSDRSLPGFYACPCCVKSLEVLFPVLNDSAFHRARGSRQLAEEKTCSLRADSSRFTTYVDLLESTANQALEYRRAPNMYRFVELAKSMGATSSCTRDDMLRGKGWHVIPTLPEFTICSECYEDVVWPAVLKGSPLASQVLRRPQVVGKAQEGVSCQVYGERMRKVFLEACKDDDFEYLRRAALRRHRVERELQKRIVEAQRLPREEREEEMEDIVDEWMEWD